MDEYWDSLEDGLGEVEPLADESLEDDEPLEAESGVEVVSDPEALEAEARRAASAKADAISAEWQGLSDEPRTGPYGDDPVMRDQWTDYLEKSLTEAAEERARIQAVFDAQDAGLAEDQGDPLDPVDFSGWDSESFAELVDRVTGAVPRNTPRRAVDDLEWDRAVALMEV